MSIRCSVIKALRLASSRLSVVPAKRCIFSVASSSHSTYSPARYKLSAAAVGLALIAAEYIYNEKNFFKAAKVGNVQELRK